MSACIDCSGIKVFHVSVCIDCSGCIKVVSFM